MTDIQIKEAISKSDYVSLDGPMPKDIESLANELNGLGDPPQFIEEDAVRKALATQSIDYDELIKGGRRNMANLTAVRRQVVTSDGRVYMKTVYIKKEEVTDNKKSARFLDQHNAERNLAVGDRVVGRFKGYSTGAKYKNDNFKVKEIKDDKIVLEFTQPFDTNNSNGYTYPEGTTVTIPKTTNSDWNKDMSIAKYVEPQQESTVNSATNSAGEVVDSIDQISVGDPVMVKQRGNAPDVQGEIKYIHPQGNFIDIKVGDKVLRRKLGRFSTMGGSAPVAGEMNWAQVDNLATKGVDIKVWGTSAIQREDRNRVVGQEDYQTTVRVDRFGNPNDRGRSRGTVTRQRNVYHQRTDAEMEAARGEQGAEIFQMFNDKFGGFDFETYAAETQAAVNEAFPDLTDEEKKIKISIDRQGSFELNIRNPKFTMRRNFRVDSEGNTSVYHAYFSINRGSQGGGLGKKLFKALHKQYRASGIKAISVSANIDIGGYAWGRYGFSAEKHDAIRYVRSFENNVGNNRNGYTITQDDANKAREVYDNFYSDSANTDKRFPMNLICCIGPENKAGKAILKNTSWSGKLDLTNQQQRLHFENYIGFSQ